MTASTGDAIPTFVIALLGLAMAAASLLWQFLMFSLNGPRISVQLLLGVSSGREVPSRSWSIPVSQDGPYLDDVGVVGTRELIGIIVRNRGRSAVTVRMVGVSIIRRKGWIAFEERYAGPSLKPTRLEPGDALSEFTDVWPLVDFLQGPPRSHDLRINGVCELGSWKRRWSRDIWELSTSTNSIKPNLPADYEPSRHCSTKGSAGWGPLA
jgi:hypothetical protein